MTCLLNGSCDRGWCCSCDRGWCCSCFLKCLLKFAFDAKITCFRFIYFMGRHFRISVVHCPVANRKHVRGVCPIQSFFKSPNWATKPVGSPGKQQQQRNRGRPSLFRNANLIIILASVLPCALRDWRSKKWRKERKKGKLFTVVKKSCLWPTEIER